MRGKALQKAHDSFLYQNGDVNNNEIFRSLAAAQTFKDVDEKLISDIEAVMNHKIITAVKEKMGKKFSILNTKDDYRHIIDEDRGGETSVLLAWHLFEISYDKKVFFDMELEFQLDRYAYDYDKGRHILLDKFRLSNIDMKLRGYCIAKTTNYNTNFNEGYLTCDRINYDNIGKLIAKSIKHYISEKKRDKDDAKAIRILMRAAKTYKVKM